MDKGKSEKKKFLEEQLDWCRKQDFILATIEAKLYEMRALAEYAYEHKLSPSELNMLNDQLNELKREVNSLEKQLHSIVH